MSINPFDRIQSCYEDMTPTDREIAVYILNSPREAARLSITEVARQTGSSKSALVRFANRIGYSGYAEFKFDLSRFLVSRNASANADVETGDAVRNITETYSRYILQIQEACTGQDLSRLASLIIQANRIKIFGYDRTFNSAMQLRQRLAKIGIDAEAVNDIAIMSDLPDILNKKDLVIVFTISNNGAYNDYVTRFADRNVPVIVLTMTPNLPYQKFTREYIVLPRISRDSNISFLDDQAIYMVFIELLMDAAAAQLQKQNKDQ